jgi:hypothetical protein
MALYYLRLGEHSFRDSSLSLEAGFQADISHLEVGLTNAIDAPIAARHNTWREGRKRFSFTRTPEVSAIVAAADAQYSLAIRINGVWNSGDRGGHVSEWFDVILPEEVGVAQSGQETIAYR